ncbi:MAG: hypothetical protein ACREJC_08965 [Tepidisphaeraceae bacterium]
MNSSDYALTAYGIVFAISVVAGVLALATMFKKDPTKAVEALKAFYDGGNALRIITVAAILATVGMLAYADKLTDSIVSLLSGIAGFVLGGLSPGGKAPPGNDTPPKS